MLSRPAMTDAPRFGSLRSLGLLAAFFLAVMFADLALEPDPVRANPAADQFDARAARERLVRILGDETPHPVDNAAQDHVRGALLQEISALGFTPEVRDTFTCRAQPRGPLIDCARVRNIVFSIGPAEGPAILAAAHYDSVPAAPGASDDGLGLSVWLEVARMLSKERLQRRVAFLFSDGEEPALLGAYAFAEADPLMASVESLVNLEARGSRGPAVFFESNQPNADAAAAFSAAPRPIANSVMADVYRLLSNSTDVTALTRDGLDVLNIALLDGLEDYHTPQDTIASQDLRSVQHMGDVALAVTRRLVGAPDADVATPMVYTDIASRAFIVAPVWLGQAALAFSALLSLFAFVRSTGTSRWRAAVAPVLGVVFAGALAFAVGFGLSVLRAGEAYAFAHPEPTRAWCVLLALFTLVLALMTLRAARSSAQAGAAAMFWFALIGGVASIFVSGISILFALPAVAYAIAWLISIVWKPAAMIGAWAAAVLVLIVWAPLLHLIELALGFDMPFVFTILVALMALPWIGPLIQTHGDARWRIAAATLGVASVAAIVVAAITPGASSERPRSLNISYFLNTTDGQARVIAGSAERALPRELQGPFEAEPILPGDRSLTWAAAAPIEQIAAPSLQDVSASEENGERVVRGRLVMNGAYRALIRIPIEAAPLRTNISGAEASFADTESSGAEYMSLACQGRACEGAEVSIALSADGADADWYIIGQFPGHASPAADAVRARRPASATPIQFGDSVVTLSRFRPQR
jgi:hypothetical protein